jgi:hypothetical protein
VRTRELSQITSSQFGVHFKYIVTFKRTLLV